MRRITPMSTDDRHDGASHQLQKLELVISGVPGKLPLETIKRELVGSGGRHLPILLLDSVVMATPSQMENQRLRAIGQM
jgi:hypothetical protein